MNLDRYVAGLPPAETTFTVYSPSPGTAAWREHQKDFICDPIKYYDCMHTILPARLPLKEFYRHFASLTSGAISRNPLRAHNVPVKVGEILRMILLSFLYIRCQRNLWRDYDRKHW